MPKRKPTKPKGTDLPQALSPTPAYTMPAPNEDIFARTVVVSGKYGSRLTAITTA